MMTLRDASALLLVGLGVVSYRRPGLLLALFVLAAIVWLVGRPRR